MPILAQETADQIFDLQPLFKDHGIPLALMGMIVVFAALLLVTLFISMLPRIMTALDHLMPEPVKPTVKLAPKPSGDNDIPEEILVVIAAAVAEAIDKPHRIVRARELTTGWSLQGRMQLHTSHKLKPQDGR